ncbi:MAG: COX15/CtaA family protein [Rhodospirillales bacterium]|nr:MAG: COX15/CtaA family protein [Rhodospirillales bacterium]
MNVARYSGMQPDTRRNVAIWLLVCSGMVAAMVIIGGITRLTESGLSMTEWRPLVGWIPPLSEAEWQRIFERYRLTSEYRIQFPGMDLEEFKTIFWWEYIHRVWGRLIGLAFGLPLLWFMLRRRIDRPLVPHLVVLFLLGGLQGLIGWWMVNSGFVDRDDVSQYRLTVHLGMAIIILGYLLWVAFGLLSSGDGKEAPPGLRTLSRVVVGAAFITILSGGMVAGINAGLIHNTWPLMDGGVLPDGMAAMSPIWLNAFENHATVQFNHRLFAYITALLTAVLWLRARRAGLGPRAHRAVNALAIAVICQVILGISTLLLVVPIGLAVLHQAGAVAVFALALWCSWELPAATTAQLRPAPR